MDNKTITTAEIQAIVNKYGLEEVADKLGCSKNINILNGYIKGKVPSRKHMGILLKLL